MGASRAARPIAAMRAAAATAAMWAVIGFMGGIGLAQEPARPQPATAPAPAPATATTSPAVMLEKGIYTEETVGDLDAAIKIYQQIVEDAKAGRQYAAQAQYRLGMCYFKKRQSTEAVNCFKELIAAYSDQTELVAKARQQIAKAREDMSQAEVARIVGDVVTDISTMAESDSRIPGLLQSLRELKEPAVVKELTKYFDSDKNTVRRAAIYIVWKGEFSDASPAVPGLVKLCSHEEDLTRGMAAIALGGMKADSAFDKLADMTSGDKSSYARRAAAYALGLLGKQEARPILEKALKDPDQFVRNNAEAALTMLAKAGAAGPAAPRAIKTTPEFFANDVDPSLDKITVTFDRPMMDKNWSFTCADKALSEETGMIFPERAGEISYDAARTTCTMPVKLQPGKVYWVGINSPSHKNFKAADGTPASGYLILFATKSADGKPTAWPAAEKWLKGLKVIDADKKEAERLLAEAFKAKLINWVEKFFSENYRDITARKTIEWGQPETTAGGNLAIRYKYLATIWNKDKQIIEQRFTFTPQGKYVSAETIEKGPAPAEMTAAPSVVETTPVTFADDVDPSLDKITVTFDRPMMDKSWSWTGGGETYPESAGNISYDANRTTCTMPVKLQPGKVYWVGVNSPSHRNFKTPDRVPAKWYIILFATRSADGKPKPLPADMLKRAKAINAAAATQQAEPSEQVKRDAENLSAEGWALWNQRKLPEAEAKFKAAVEKDPTNANAWNGLGWAQMNQGKVLNAKDAFEKAVAADPKLAGALNGLGWIAKGQGKTDEAMRFWRQAVEALPSATAALSGLASTLYEQGQYEKAVEHYQAMLKIEPDSAEAKAGLAKAEMARQAIAAAAPVAQAWITLVDEGKIAESWEQSSKLFQTGIAKDKWGAVLKSAREPLGKLQSRKLISATYMTSVPGAPDGQYLVVQFEAVFENKRQAVETVTPMKGKDGKWRVSGYYIK